VTWPPGLVLGSAWAAGVATGAVLTPNRASFGAAALVAAFATAGLALVARPALVSLAVGAALLGLARSELPQADPGIQRSALQAAGQAVEVQGVVADDPRSGSEGYEVLVRPLSVVSAAGPLPPLGNLLVRVRGPGEVAVDDRVEVAGRLRLPADQPGFDRRAYLAENGCFLELASSGLFVTARSGGLRGLPGWLRNRYREAVSALVPQPHAALLVGIVLGIRSGIPPALEKDLVATGLVHLLVLSGLKVAVFARLALGALTPLLGRAASLPVAALVGLYALAGGATPAAVRAAAMGALTLLAARLSRPTHVWSSLGATAGGMLAWKPELAWDVGFQLSFAGTAAIVLLASPVERRLGWLPGWLREPFAVTIAAQVGTVPLMATDFHLLSPVAPVANAVVLPLLPWMVTAGLLLAPLAAVPDVGRLAALPLVGLLTYTEQAAAFLARLPVAALPFPSLAGWPGATYYAVLGGLVAGARAEGRRRAAGLALAVLAPLALGLGELAAWARASPSASVLAVGDGQAVLIGGPSGEMLVDGGPSPARLRDELGQRLPPWQRRLDAVVVTGPGRGHVGGLAGFDLPVGIVAIPAGPIQGAALASFVVAVAARGSGVLRLGAGDELRVAGLQVQALAPEPLAGSGPAPGDPAGYLALRVRAPSGRTFCDLSELDSAAQLAAAARLRGRCDYLLLPGAGRSSPPPGLLAAARPSLIVASLGSGQVAREVPPALLRRTDQEGTITLAM
jgi:competence protein ComEC